MPRLADTLEIPLAEQSILREISNSPDVQSGVATRAKILLLKAQGLSMRGIAAKLGIHYNMVYNWVKRYKSKPDSCDLYLFLSSAKGGGRKRELDNDAIAWVKQQNAVRIQRGETKAAFLARIHRDAEAAGFPRLATFSRQGIQGIIGTDEND